MKWNKRRVQLFQAMFSNIPDAIQDIWVEWTKAYNAIHVAEGYTKIIDKPQEYRVTEISGGYITFGYGEYMGHGEYEQHEHVIPIEILYDSTIIEKMYYHADQVKTARLAKAERERLANIEENKKLVEAKRVRELAEYERLDKIYGNKKLRDRIN